MGICPNTVAKVHRVSEEERRCRAFEREVQQAAAMVQKTSLQSVIRPYKPTDKSAIVSLFRFGILEHVYPSFFKAMSHPDHIGVTLSVSVAGYVLGGSSYFQAVLFGGAWACLVYYCCHEIYDSFLKVKMMDVEMADIQAKFLDNQVNHFWVAEVEVNGKWKVSGLLAVVGEKGGVSKDGWNADDAATAEVFQLIVSFHQRRKGLGTQLVETAVEFCKEQGLSRVVVEISSPQTAAISIFRKLGFTVTSVHSYRHPNHLVSKLARINVIRMEKHIL
ncbi:N-acetyltransferase family 8 member 3 [Rhinichthys klamathensis goyatoka]|uniref:N-acetyltransferase family 8 member 3 n=1 Tax=Rhinichthys klamathensis goyatoka TaxID=3034132 RepID=UPI0024B61AF4|nr:N-acetyltransferase family 8 member 3 [Rhinichthys klamathensis goyatoka]